MPNKFRKTPIIKKSYDFQKISLFVGSLLALLLLITLGNYLLSGAAQPPTISTTKSINASPTPFPQNFDAEGEFKKLVQENNQVNPKDTELFERFLEEIEKLKAKGDKEKANAVAKDALRFMQEMGRLKEIGENF